MKLWYLLSGIYFAARLEIESWPMKFWQNLAWYLPARLIYFAAIRVVAHASSGRWVGEDIPHLTAMEAIKRWEPRCHFSNR